MCYILAHALDMDEKFNCILGIIQTSICKLLHNNYNNI
jgi:hypothetical protein